ncbi:MAG: O-antigen ligase family protein [Bacteroidota bacterium]
MKEPLRKNVNRPENQNSKYFDLMSLLFLTGYLMIDFLPYLQRMEIISIQFLYLTILNITAGLFIYFNPTLHSNALIYLFKKSYIFKAYLAFILLAGLSIFGAKNISLGVNAIAEILVIFSMFVNITILLYNRLHLLYKLTFIMGLFALIQASQALLDFKNLVTDLSITDTMSQIITIEGNTGNINIFSSSLMAKIPFILIGITYFTNWKKWVLMGALLLSTLLVFLISAKASLLSLIIIYIVFLVYYFKTNHLKKINISSIAALVLPMLISFALINYIFSKNNNSARYAPTIQRLGQINTSRSSISARLMFWETAVNFTKSNPVLGIGLDNWRVESIPHEKLRSLVVSLHTHNDFLQIFAETGVVNGLIYFSIFIALLWINLKRLLKPGQDHNKVVAILTLMLLIVYGVDALFNFPFYRPTMQLCFCFLLALTFVNTTKTDHDKLSFKKRAIALMLVGIPIVPFYFTYYADQTSQLEYKIKADNIDFNTSGKVKAADIINQKPLLPNVFNTSESFYEYAGIYFLREKKYDEALKYLDLGNKVNPYLGRPNFYKYLMATERGMPDSAVHYIKAAFYASPANPDFFKALITHKKYVDTTEILAMYKRSISYAKSVVIWNSAVTALQSQNYSDVNLLQFLNQGLKDFPKDNKVKSIYNTTLITGYIIKGQRLFANAKHEEALKSYLKALTLDSTNVYALQNIGFYYFNLRNSAKAIPYLLGALQKPGLNGGKTEYFLALCYIDVNDKSNACKYLNVANAMGYSEAQARLNQYCN